MINYFNMSLLKLGLSERICVILARHQVKTVDTLVHLTAGELSGVLGIGAASLAQIRFILSKHGLSLAKEDKGTIHTGLMRIKYECKFCKGYAGLMILPVPSTHELVCLPCFAREYPKPYEQLVKWVKDHEVLASSRDKGEEV